jgi:DNA mismatch repair protein MutS2
VVRESLKETSEATRLLSENKHIALSETPDVRSHIDALQIEHRALDAHALVELATFARVTDRARSNLSTIAPELARMRKLGAELPNLDPLRAEIEKAIDTETATIKDHASPQLRSLRARIFKLRNRLRSILESYFRQKDSRKVLQDQIITERNGRSVLPVRSECRGDLVGIVHGTSSSGATLFIEPLSTVEINNDIVSLEDQERQEVERILLALTDEARSCTSELTQAVELLSRLDLVQAKALLSESYRGAEPAVDEGKDLHLVGARHPLLISKVAERAGLPSPAREAVPVTFRVNRERSALVFTGPNTGGKTVALKTAGLLALMAQSGLHVPADSSSSFPVFKKIFVDIGDEQSIGSSLSTFSAHLNHIVEMERDLEEPSLVLLDEVGSGTDPAEGGALGTALVDHFRRRGALVLASTHHGMLKTYATTTPGVNSASFQFDPETYEPLYQLVVGSTGRSLALEMALRLGLPGKVVDRARELQSEKERQVEDMLHRLESDSHKLDQDKEELARERKALDEALHRQKEKEREFAQSRKEEMETFKANLREETEQARAELREILLEAKQRMAAEARQPRALSIPQLEKQADERIEHIEAQLAPSPPETEPRPSIDVNHGDRVTISSLGLTGIVVEILGNDEVEVSVRDKKLRIPLSDLEAASPARPVEISSYRTYLPDRKLVPQELNVIGCTVDEALSQADKFLDDAFLSEYRTVRLIHGLGKGRLRNALREWLTTHPHVTGHQSEQSGAVTVVELKD